VAGTCNRQRKAVLSRRGSSACPQPDPSAGQPRNPGLPRTSRSKNPTSQAIRNGTENYPASLDKLLLTLVSPTVPGVTEPDATGPSPAAIGPDDALSHAGQVVRRVLLRRNIVIDAETAQLVAAAVQAALQAGAPSRPPRQGPRAPAAGREPLS
jgi:hypothetical protein